MNLIEKIIVAGYLGSFSIYGALLINRAVDDSKAVAKVTVNPEYFGEDSHFLAFDRNNDREIDEIKVYHFTFAHRGAGAMFLEKVYDKNDPQFTSLKEKYFSKK